jgi:NAD(P)-dependent dehydrogenase (short-subunit alcohol dehydrogenase family)
MPPRQRQVEGPLQGRLEGKAALVTGGAQRIGQAIALELARAGANVAITYLQSERAARALTRELQLIGVKALALKCDVRNPKSVKDVAKSVVKQFGGLDILVNNAGFYETASFEELTPDQWDNILRTNTRGPFLVAQALLPALRKQGGRIVNLGSLGGVRPWSSHGHYCVSKAALHMLTRVMAKALAPGIAVNAVAPGMIETDAKASRDQLARMAAKTPMKRNGTPEDVVEAVLFFATATRFITGQVLYVDGGLGLAT